MRHRIIPLLFLGLLLICAASLIIYLREPTADQDVMLWISGEHELSCDQTGAYVKTANGKRVWCRSAGWGIEIGPVLIISYDKLADVKRRMGLK